MWKISNIWQTLRVATSTPTLPATVVAPVVEPVINEPSNSVDTKTEEINKIWEEPQPVEPSVSETLEEPSDSFGEENNDDPII